MAQGNSNYWLGQITARLKDARYAIMTDHSGDALIHLDLALEQARSNLPDCPRYRVLRAYIVTAHQALTQGDWIDSGWAR